MVMCRAFIIILCLMFLNACVIETSKPEKIVEEPKKDALKISEEVEAEFNLALSHLKSKEYDEAVKILEKIVLQEKRIPAPFVNLGMAYNKTGQPKKAEAAFLQALKIELTNPVANNQLGLLYRKLGRFNDAKKAYTNALTEYPDYLPIVKNVGILCELYMRDLPCALKYYEHYLDLQPDDKTMKIWVADVSRRIK